MDPLTVVVRPAARGDAGAWLELRRALWPESPDAEHREEIERYFAGSFEREPWAVLLAEVAQSRIVGFVELSIRPYAEACTTRRVAYLEGWFVQADLRGGGVGRALIAAAQDWGRAQGCTEFASDADPANEISIAAHLGVGFEDAGLVRCFRKSL